MECPNLCRHPRSPACKIFLLLLATLAGAGGLIDVLETLYYRCNLLTEHPHGQALPSLVLLGSVPPKRQVEVLYLSGNRFHRPLLYVDHDRLLGFLCAQAGSKFSPCPIFHTCLAEYIFIGRCSRGFQRWKRFLHSVFTYFGGLAVAARDKVQGWNFGDILDGTPVSLSCPADR